MIKIDSVCLAYNPNIISILLLIPFLIKNQTNGI